MKKLFLTLVLLIASVGARAQPVPVPAPLTGAVTPSGWVANNTTYPGITLACGKPFHYILAQPPQYNPTAYKYPLYIWLHPDYSGNENYIGAGGDLFKMASNEAGAFNTQAFQTRHPSFIAAPSADQTNGNGTFGSCNNRGDSAVMNWGGWFHTGNQAGSGTVYSGDTGPNTFAILAMVNDLKTRYSIDPARVYVNGFSLGGIGSDYFCYHYNAYNGDKGKVFAACGGIAGINNADVPVTAAKAATMTNVPQWVYGGVNDNTSPQGPWNTALCNALGGNSASLTGITSPAANRCGTSQMRYTLAPGVGHQDTDAGGNAVWSNQIINDFLFAQVAPGGTPITPPVVTGKFHVAGGKIIAPNGSVFKGVGINIGDFRANLDMASAVTNFTTGAPLTTLFPGINFVRIALYGGGSAAAPTTYPAASSYDAFVNAVTSLGIVVEFEHHIGTTGSSAGGGQGVVPAPGSAWVNAENANYAALATRFKDNPYVWFGTNNEPPSATGLSAWQKSNYDAIRNTGNQNPVMLEVWGSRPPGYGGTPLQQGMVQSIYSAMTNVIWDPHVYPFINGNNTSAASNNQTPIDMAAAAQTITSADGIVPVIIGEFGPSTTGSSIEANATQTVTGVLASGFGSAVWHWRLQDCCNNLNSGDTVASLTPLGVQVAAAIKANVQQPGTVGESLAFNTIAPPAQNTAFVVSGTIGGVTTAPSLQYSDNGITWFAMPAGAVVTSTTFRFTNPGLAANGHATVSVRDANNNAITTTSAPFIIRAPESANNTIAVPSTSTTNATFSDTFTSLSLHNTWQAGDKWQLVAPDTPAGRGGPNFGENGNQWWVNPFNSNTPISGIYTQDGAGLHLGLIGTPSGQQAYINAQAGAALPYVGGLMNTSQTSYQKYGYWEFKVSVPKVPGFTWQADTENVQITGQFPPEIDLRIGTDANGVQTVLFEFALGGGQYTKFTAPTTFDPTAMHTYGWDWEADFITFYIDNVQMFQAANPSAAYSTNPMFLFLVTASNYIGNTGNPALGSLPVNANVQAVNIYPIKPGAANGPSASIVDNLGNVFFITAGGQVNINGTVDGTTSNVIELAYVNQVLWQENAAGNWYNYLGTPGSYGGPTTTSPVTGGPPAFTESADQATVTTAGPIITDANGTTFAISSGGLILINGITDPSTSNVVELAYVNHTLWQENSTGNWRNYLGTPGSYGAATTNSPLAGGPPIFTESSDQTIVTTVGPVITDATGNTFAISSGGQILINGTADGSTSNVTELAYVAHVLWQENAAGNWYSYLGTPGSYAGPTTTSPLTGGPTFTESGDRTIVTTVGPIITDATGNTFAISSGAQILINGAVDPSTSNVIEMAYVSHVLWQQNSAGNWYNYLGAPGSYGGPTTSPLSSPGVITGQFSISGGKVIDPNGNVFLAHGINVDESEAPKAITNALAQPLTTLFPHINFIRVPVRSTSGVGTASAVYPDPASYATFVARATALGIVVEFEDHNSNGGQWECFIPGGIGCQPSYPPTGGALTTMLNFWKSLATLYKGNPYVWIGSLNEINSADGTYSANAIAAVTIYEDALYRAIRAVAPNMVIQMANGIGGFNPGTLGINAASGSTVINVPATTATWHNITWYLHAYYSNGTPDGALAYLTGSTLACCGGAGGSGYVAAQTLQSGDGLVPVIFDECGSGTGNSSNGDGSAMVSALGGGVGLTGGGAATLQAKGVGFACWAWFPSATWQMVNNGDTAGGPFSLTTWGQQMSDMIKTFPGPTPPAGPRRGKPMMLIFGANDNDPVGFFRMAR